MKNDNKGRINLKTNTRDDKKNDYERVRIEEKTLVSSIQKSGFRPQCECSQ